MDLLDKSDDEDVDEAVSGTRWPRYRSGVVSRARAANLDSCSSPTVQSIQETTDALRGRTTPPPAAPSAARVQLQVRTPLQHCAATPNLSTFQAPAEEAPQKPAWNPEAQKIEKARQREQMQRENEAKMFAEHQRKRQAAIAKAAAAKERQKQAAASRRQQQLAAQQRHAQA